jgi:putative ABC transport system ATP-binding protein
MLLRVERVSKVYEAGPVRVGAVADVSFAVSAGEIVAVTGPSGCGKSTLLHLCGAMDAPTSGRLEFEGRDLAGLDDDGLTKVRRTRVGFVFQFFNLLPTLTVAENIALPALLGGADRRATLARARGLAERVGLAARADHYPPQLSGGELQRTALARAVVHAPALLIADEPTGSLDSANGRAVMRLLHELNCELGVTVLLATHDPALAVAAARVLEMRDGRLVGERTPARPDGARATSAPAGE